MSEIDIDIKKTRFQKSLVKRILVDGRQKAYPQYRLPIPKEFIERHGEEVYIIIDTVEGVGFFVSDKPTLRKILDKFPAIRKYVIKRKKLQRSKRRSSS